MGLRADKRGFGGCAVSAGERRGRKRRDRARVRGRQRPSRGGAAGGRRCTGRPPPPKPEPGWLWTGGQGVSLPAPSLRSGRASRELPVHRDEVAGEIWKPPQPGAVTRQPARRREPRTRSPRGRPAHARWPSARLPGFGSPTAGREERACAEAPLGFSEQPGSRSRPGYLLASVVQD